MKFSCTALFLILCTLFCASGAGAAPSAEGLGEVLEYTLMKTAAGSEFLGRVTGVVSTEVSQPAYRSFMQRLGWAQMAPLNEEVRSVFKRIQTEFEVYRGTQNRAPKLAEGEHLTADEKEFLAKAAEQFKSNRIDDFMKQSIEFVDAYIGPHARPEIADSDAFRNPLIGEGEVPPLPTMTAAAGQDLRELRLHFWQKMGIRFGAYRDVFRAYWLSEGQWRALFMDSGRPFTLEDLVSLRKSYRVLGVLNDYSRTRLVIRAFAQERSVIYTRLNQLTAESTREYMEGGMTIGNYVKARESAAKSLELNDIVWEAEKRMLTVIKRCQELGGRVAGDQLGSGEIALARQNVEATKLAVQEAQAKLAEIELQLRSSNDLDLRRALTPARGKVSLERQRQDAAAQALADKYLEFIENRGQIEIFANLRMGRLNSEIVAPFDMPDPFVVSQKQLDLWDPVYDEAIKQAITPLLAKESAAFWKAQAGSTRKFIRELNDKTGEFFGKRFTETEYGLEFQAYEKHLAVVLLQRVGLTMGLTLTPAVLDKYGAMIAQKIHDAVFKGGAADGAKDPKKTSASRTADDADEDAKPAPKPAVKKP